MSKSKRQQRLMKRALDDELAWALHCEKPPLKKIRQLLEDGANINARDEFGASILMHAVRDKRVPKKIVRFLVEHGADVTTANDEGDSVLATALQNRHLEKDTVELLLSRGANVNAVNKDGRSVLMDAAGVRPVSTKITELLIQRGADVNAVWPQFGNSVLAQAVFFNRLDAVKILVKHGVQVDPEDAELLAKACMQGGPELMAFLLSKGLNPNLLVEPAVSALDFVENLRDSIHKKASAEEDEFGLRMAERFRQVAKVLEDAGAKHTSRRKMNHRKGE